MGAAKDFPVPRDFRKRVRVFEPPAFRVGRFSGRQPELEAALSFTRQ